MNLFKNDVPHVEEIVLHKRYDFMYENFIISNQHQLYLMLEVKNKIIDALLFNSSVYKYGYPNDEAGHPLYKYGLGFYGLHIVHNSPWIKKLKYNNRNHPSHDDALYSNKRHYIAKFKDVTLEVISNGKFELVQITNSFLHDFVDRETKALNKDS